MGKLSRTKGATYEREVAAALFDELGMTFTRNLEQVRTEGQGDLECDDPDFPFLIECKRRKGGAYSADWMRQATKAANAKGMIPAVFYRFDNKQTRCVVPFSAIMGSGPEWPVEMGIPAFCALAREIMADNEAAAQVAEWVSR